MAWMHIFHGQERDFWKNQTPRKLDALLRAYAPQQSPKKEQSLSAYIMGGGG